MVKKYLTPKFFSSTVMARPSSKKVRIQNQRSARLRRQRGYHWEDTIVKRFNDQDNWRAFRLGSASNALPDILAVNTPAKTIYTIEAKSGTGTSLFVPAEQIERCMRWLKTFDIYKKRQVILAFKFLSKKRVDIDVYKSRELREFFKIWDEGTDITDCVCSYDGQISIKIDGVEKAEIALRDGKMPFQIKNGRRLRPTSRGARNGTTGKNNRRAGAK